MLNDLLLQVSLFISFIILGYSMKTAVHIKCRGGCYPFTDIARLVFPDELVPWNVPFKNYNPPEYTSPSLKGKPYADPEIGNQTKI